MTMVQYVIFKIRKDELSQIEVHVLDDDFRPPPTFNRGRRASGMCLSVLLCLGVGNDAIAET